MRTAVRCRLFAVLFAALLAGGVQAHDDAVDGLHIGNPWARATAPGLPNGAVYFELTIDDGADRLVGVSTPRAKRAMIHRSSEKDGQSSMQHVDAVTVSAGEPVAFEPGGYHVMLMMLGERLEEGERFPLTLRFEQRGEIEVTVHVEAMSHTP